MGVPIETELDMVERHVRVGEIIIARQRALIDRLSGPITRS